jgi:hypothetical protein
VSARSSITSNAGSGRLYCSESPQNTFHSVGTGDRAACSLSSYDRGP